MSKLKNFISNLNDSNDAANIAARFGIKDIKAHTPVISGNQNNTEVKKTMTETIYGHRADGTAISREYAEKNLNTWYQEAATLSELGDMVVQLMQSMTMANAPADFRITTESDFQAEVKRGKELLGLN